MNLSTDSLGNIRVFQLGRYTSSIHYLFFLKVVAFYCQYIYIYID